MPPLLIPVVTLVIALAGLVLAIFALVLIAAQRLDNAQLPARRRSDRDPDDANARALFGRSDFRPRPFRMSDTEPIPKSDPIADAIAYTNYHFFPDPKTDAEPIPKSDPIAQADCSCDSCREAERKYRSDRSADLIAEAERESIATASPFADTDVFADFISISDPKTVYLTDFKSDRDS
jgi:hypothetical protein